MCLFLLLITLTYELSFDAEMKRLQLRFLESSVLISRPFCDVNRNVHICYWSINGPYHVILSRKNSKQFL